MERVEASVARYLAALETADRQEEATGRARTERLKDRLARLEQRMAHLREMEAAVRAAPDGQISLTDPDARAMATTVKDTGLVGYNVQAAVDTKRHLIVAHDVTNIGNDRAQLSGMSELAREAMARRPSPSWPTGATSTARRSSPASRPASHRSCPSR